MHDCTVSSENCVSICVTFNSFCRYKANLTYAKNINIKRGFLSGLGFGILWFLIYASYALAFWYGVGLVLEDKYKPEDETVFMPQTMVTVRNHFLFTLIIS
jgi:ATP-binding cassette subfamily B (MDR/TAP) protein 1